MRVFLSAGEASGDAYGAELVLEMQRLQPDGSSLEKLEFEGLGGRRMRDAGVRLIADTGAWGAITAVHSAIVVPRVVRGYYRSKMQMRRKPAGLFVPIDFGFANIRLARHAKNQGWKVL